MKFMSKNFIFIASFLSYSFINGQDLLTNRYGELDNEIQIFSKQENDYKNQKPIGLLQFDQKFPHNLHEIFRWEVLQKHKKNEGDYRLEKQKISNNQQHQIQNYHFSECLGCPAKLCEHGLCSGEARIIRLRRQTGSGNTIKGDKGDKGEKGSHGGIGFRGSKGDKGSTGEKGATADKGEKGDIGEGEKGAIGDKGETGAKGDKGDNGTGEKGATGDKGDKGESGAVGDKGEKGSTGEKGEGEKGAVGDKGEKGSTGDKGATGVKGDPQDLLNESAEYFRLLQQKLNEANG